jgi:hypothetical protein
MIRKDFKTGLLLICFLLMSQLLYGAMILIPMDDRQKNHLKAYGITYWVLTHDQDADWLLNYRGGSFAFPYHERFERECNIRGVSFEIISDAQYSRILEHISNPEVNKDVVKLEVAPNIAVYTPENTQPWDDAVTLALTYAEIPYDAIYDDEVLENKLPLYDWLHLHHEDFTGQFGKFWASYRNAPWYKEEVRYLTEIAERWGFSKVSDLKLAVAKKIRDYTIGGGYLFAMCSATDTYDIALAAENVDIVETMFDGDPMDRNANEKLDFSNTFAFHNFQVVTNPYEYEYSTIDNNPQRRNAREEEDFFTLFEFSAKWDQIPSMLVQNHTRVVKGFLGQTTAFRNQYIKPSVTILGEARQYNEARYIHGTAGNGMWTFYGGHDPEDYRHLVGDPPTDLNLYPNSPGYRLILNNVLFPAARPEKRKTELIPEKEYELAPGIHFEYMQQGFSKGFASVETGF